MTFPSFDTKDPDDVLSYSWDFSDFLATAETISTIAFPDFPAGLTLDSSSNTSTVATAVISGGTAGTSYDVTCRITTSAGQTKDVTLTIPVAET